MRAFSTDTLFELSVSNVGDPIPAATVAHLFQPFFRASAVPNQQGLGLGLPGARRLMDEFDVVSEVGKGTTVTMTKWR